jgi:hypothetical protein
MRTDDETANELSKFINTDKQVKQTSRSNEEGHTGENSNNVVDEFVINPNKIKRLRDLEGDYYSHNRPSEPSKFYTKFVKTENVRYMDILCDGVKGTTSFIDFPLLDFFYLNQCFFLS